MRASSEISPGPFAPLPMPRAALVGRESQLRAIVEALSDGCPLLTITGPGGVGKTRLALAAAAAMTEPFGGRVAFVDLAAVRDHRDVAGAVADALRVRVASAEQLEEATIDALGLEQTLLVVDNFEHVLDASELIARLVERAPLLSILATSRARLGVAVETTFALAPLAIDPPAASAAATNGAAVELFARCARAALPSFTLDPTNVGDVVALCRWLDGLPLAIELAAARTPLLSPRELLARLSSSVGRPGDGGLGLLVTDGADRPARHRALHNAISWSVALLTADQRLLLERLVVFEGGWTLDAVERVCEAEHGREAVIQSLDALLRHHLVVRDSQPPTSASLPTRYRMLETVRQFARALTTDAADIGRLRARHGAYFQSLAREARDGLESADEAVWTARLEQEDANIRAAIAYFERAGDPLGCLALASALGRHWRNSGRWDVGRAWLRRYYDAVCEKGGGEPATDVVVDALGWMGRLAVEDGVAAGAAEDLQSALDSVARSLALARSIGDAPLLLRAMEATIAASPAGPGPARTARKVCVEALALSIELGDRWWQAMFESWRGVQLRIDGDLVGAEWAGSACRALARSDGNRHMSGLGGWVLGSVLIEARRFDEAKVVLKEAIEDNLAALDRRSAAFCHLSFGSVALAARDLATAADHLRHGLVLAQESSDWVGVGFASLSLLSLASRSGQHRSVVVLWGGLRGDTDALYRIYPTQRRAVERAVEAARVDMGESNVELLARHAEKGGRREAVREALEVAETVLAGEPTGLSTATEPNAMASANPHRLSRREIEVLGLIAAGCTNQEITARLFVSIGTVERHVANVYRKIGARRRADATAYAVRNGFAG